MPYFLDGIWQACVHPKLDNFSIKLFGKFNFNFWFVPCLPIEKIQRALSINLCKFKDTESWNIYSITTKEYDITPHINNYPRDKYSKLDLGSSGIYAFYDSFNHLFRAYDFVNKRAVYIYPENYIFSEWEQHSPFREFWHLWALHNDALLIHSGIISINGKAILLPGAGGSGKSTTVLSCLQNNMQTTGDDYNLIYNNRAYPLYSNIKLKTSGTFDFPFIHNWKKETVSYAEKIIYYPPENSAIWDLSYPEVVGIMRPDISTQKHGISPIKASEIIRHLAVSSIMQSPFMAAEYLAKASGFVKNVEVANLGLSRDLEDNVECIRNYLKGKSCI